MWYKVKNNKALIVVLIIFVVIIYTEYTFNRDSYTKNVVETETLVQPETVEVEVSEPDIDITVKDDGESSTDLVSVGSWGELLNQVVVEGENVSEEYDRAFFKHWVDADRDGCDTRREVLKHESLTPVVVVGSCTIISGEWLSPYDGKTFVNPGDLDIDHMVPLKEAWRSGAHAWDDSRREKFANDVEWEYSLIAVSASTNRSKSDRDPAAWLPPQNSFTCEYVYQWVTVKIRWDLTMDAREFDTIKRITESECKGYTVRTVTVVKP
jgi:hypothetical protein